MSGPPRAPRSPLLLAAVWLAGAVAAVGTGLVAVDLVASQVGDPTVAPLTRGEVSRAVASPSRSATATPSTTSTRSATPSARPTSRTPAPATNRPSSRPPAQQPPQTRTFSSRGGSVGVRCANGTPSLVYASPANGYAVLDRKAEEGRVEVRFAKDGKEDNDARIRVVCNGSTPVQDAHG